jgi:hypothetical protein
MMAETTAGQRELARGSAVLDSSRGGTRTPDPVINSHLLYQLSYSGSECDSRITGTLIPVKRTKAQSPQ